MIFLLSIHFLDDRYHGQTDNGEKPEWPPSPFRVFQAIIAGNARGGLLPAPLHKALLWLEQLAPPDIIAPQAQPGSELLTYVLNNVSDTNPNSRTPKTIRPTLLNGDRLVQYIWSFDDAHPETCGHARTLTDAARHVNALGWGIDLAIGHGEVIEHAPPETDQRTRYTPVSGPELTSLELRTPIHDSLESLERAYADFLRRYETPGVTRFEAAGVIYEPRFYTLSQQRPNVVFRMVNPDGDSQPIGLSSIAPLVGMVRELLSRPHVIAALGREVVEHDLMGHPKESTPNRVSILPLPTIRAGPTDGRIRRIMLTQPAGNAGDLCHRLARLLDGQVLRPLEHENRIPPITLERVTIGDKVTPRYLAKSHHWASVTPVLLPGYDDHKQHRGDQQVRLKRASQLVCKALHQAGITTKAEFEISRVPYWSGSLHAQTYQPREKLTHYPRYHVRLRFEQSIQGPLAIGAGRHSGFGVFAAIDE